MRRSARRLRRLFELLAARMPEPNPAALDGVGLSDEGLAREEVERRWSEAAAARDACDAHWNLYVHVPFCKSLCSFCNYARLTIPDAGAPARFVDSVAAEAARLGRACRRGPALAALYLGGGTPSMLAAAQLERLLAAVHGAFAFAPGAQKTFEFDPMVMTDDRLEVLERFGFNHYSFGIQSLDPKVNLRHGRGRQEPRHAQEQFARLSGRRAQISVDFLAGLAGTEPRGLARDIELTLSRWRPAEVCVYFLSPPRSYLDAEFGSSAAAFAAHRERFARELPPALAAAAARRGYELSCDGGHRLGLRARGLPVVWRTAYCDDPAQAGRPLFLLGLGDAARSRIFGRLWYRSEGGVYRGMRVSPEDEVFAWAGRALTGGGRLDLGAFARLFGRDAMDALAPGLAYLRELDALEVGAQALALRGRGVRERLRDALFLLPRARRRRLLLELRGGRPACPA